jgi:hypothetical protein
VRGRVRTLLNGESPKAPRLSFLVPPLRTKQLGQIVEKGGSPGVVWAQHSFRHAEGGRTTARRHSAFGQVLLIAKTDKQSRHLRDFQAELESPAWGPFRGASFSAALIPTDCVT